MKIAGSGSESGAGSISQRHGSADPDPDPPQNVMDLQHWSEVYGSESGSFYHQARIVRKTLIPTVL